MRAAMAVFVLTVFVLALLTSVGLFLFNMGMFG